MQRHIGGAGLTTAFSTTATRCPRRQLHCCCVRTLRIPAIALDDGRHGAASRGEPMTPSFKASSALQPAANDGSRCKAERGHATNFRLGRKVRSGRPMAGEAIPDVGRSARRGTSFGQEQPSLIECTSRSRRPHRGRRSPAAGAEILDKGAIIALPVSLPQPATPHGAL
jgi:hypothetical protein